MNNNLLATPASGTNPMHELKASIGDFVTRLSDGVAKKADVSFLALLIIFAVWSGFGLLESPGFTFDEALFVDPALHYARHGFLAAPTLGPGFGHEEAYLYHTPLYFLALGYIFRLFGEGLLQARVFSVVLASCSLCLVFLIVRRSSPLAALLTTFLLAVDPLFGSRAREARPDWIALLAVLGAFSLITSLRAKGWRRLVFVLVAGVLVGVGVNSHLLYLIYGVSFGLLLIFPWALGLRECRFRWTRLAVFSLGVVVTLIPFLLYARRHPIAFAEQFKYHVSLQHEAYAKTGGWVYQEVLRYLQYFRLAPFGLIYFVGSMCAAGWLALWSSCGATEEEKAGTSTWLRTVFVVSLLGITLLSVTSGHRSWHLLILAPFLCAVGGGVAAWAAGRARHSWPAVFLCVLFFLAVLNGVAVSWVARTYSALATWGERRVDKLEPRLTVLVPRGSSVYGDYRLVFLAYKLDWKFVQHQYAYRKDPKGLREVRFDYVIASDMTGDLSGIDMADYVLVENLELGRSPFRLGKVNRTVNPISLHVFRRQPNPAL